MTRTISATAGVLGLGLLLFAGQAQAQWRDRQGNTVPDTAAQKHAGTFSAMLDIATAAEYERFMHEWTTTAKDHVPSLSTTARSHRGGEVNLVIAYAGCQPNPDTQACDATLDIRILKPDGALYGEFSQLSLAHGQPPAPDVVQISPISVRIRFEPQDPLGVYVIEARVEDAAQQARLDLRNAITVSESPDPSQNEP